MCGRYSLESPLDVLSAQIQPWLTDEDHGWMAHYAPRHRIQPSEPVLALRREHGRSGMAHMLWGLLPGWAKDPLGGPRPIHARAETLNDKASFRGPWRHHRCLLPATAFVEQGERIQKADASLFWLAGLWDRWIGADGSEVDTCCVITTRPNTLLQSLHDRMPVVIPAGLEEAWLEPGDGAHRRALEAMLEPWDDCGWSRRGTSQLSLW